MKFLPAAHAVVKPNHSHWHHGFGLLPAVCSIGNHASGATL